MGSGAFVVDEDLACNGILERKLARGLPDAIIFGDETMRDGEPTPGVAFTPAHRLQIATLLDERGVPLMTFGIPVVSREETRDLKFCADAGLDASLMAAHR